MISTLWTQQLILTVPGTVGLFIVRCVGGSKAPPVLYLSYRTFLKGTVLYDGRQGDGAKPSLFQGWRAHQRVRQPGEPQDTFANCFNPLASAKIGRSISTLAACDLKLWLLPGAFESPTSTINRFGFQAVRDIMGSR